MDIFFWVEGKVVRKNALRMYLAMYLSFQGNFGIDKYLKMAALEHVFLRHALELSQIWSWNKNKFFFLTRSGLNGSNRNMVQIETCGAICCCLKVAEWIVTVFGSHLGISASVVLNCPQCAQPFFFLRSFRPSVTTV